MKMTSEKRAKIFILLLVSVYFFAAVLPAMHFHKDGDVHDSCPICVYYQNYHSQDLPVQPAVAELILIQTYSVPSPVPGHPITVSSNDLIRAPPVLHFT